jgi:hypothetical protein
MSQSLTLILFALAALVLLWTTGGYAVRKLVIAIEGSTEFGQGTTSKLRRLKGYGVFVTWMVLATFPASFLADVGVHGDMDAALRRLGDRVEFAAYLLQGSEDDD